MKQHWTLEPNLAFLNHGSFGACPRVVQLEQRRLQQELENQPVGFLVRRLEGLFDQARERLGDFLGADAENLVAVTNATSGVNTVLRSLTFAPGDELLTTDHAYNACRNALDFVAARAGARVVVVPIPFPSKGHEQILEAVMGAVTPHTRLALLDHVTSSTGLVFPISDLVRQLEEAGVDTVVDGAHGPGMVPLDLETLGAAYYTGNCHKWLCSPKGAAFLYVRPDRQKGIVPLTLSHGVNRPRQARSRFHDLFDWTGTTDPSAFLCIPKALDVLESLVAEGWDEVRQHNRGLALYGRQTLCTALGIDPPCPEEMIGSLVALPLPNGPLPDGSTGMAVESLFGDEIQQKLLSRYRIEVPVFPFPAPPKRLIRISAQLYNDKREYQHLAEALVAELKAS